jgi:hypothetical protein
MLLWGLISTLSGNAQSFGGMIAIRFFLGFVEAAFLPGALLILSKWYTRSELTKRNALLFCGNLISNAFSALVGAGVLSNMQGVLGHAAWRWLFWIEGAATMGIAISAALILPDLPTNSRGFTEEELMVAQLRMIEDVGEVDEDSTEDGIFDGLFMALKDPKIYVLMFTLTAYVVGLSFNAFFPYKDFGIQLRSHSAYERSSVGLCLYCFPDQRLARRQNSREVLAHCWTDLSRTCRLHHQHGHIEHCRSLYRTVPTGKFLCRLHRLLLLDLIELPSSACQACCRNRSGQRIQSARKHRGLIRVGSQGEWLPQVVRYRDSHVWCHNRWLRYHEDDPGQPEQEA